MDQFERTRLLLKDKFELLKNKKILIIGVGGVGSYVVESLVRAGIENLIIVDFDTIDITNLNRQLMTNLENIGNYKVDEIEKRCLSINKNIKIKKIKEKINLENIDELFKEQIDYIVDACDTVEVKKELIRKTLNTDIKLISSMGTGNKLDPTKLEIIDIRKTNYDPIAKILRKMIKDEHINKKIMVVSSTEQPIKQESKTIASISFVPSVAGLLITSYIINDIIKGEKNEK